MTPAATPATSVRDQQGAVAVTGRVDRARVDELPAEHDPDRAPTG